MNGFVSRAVAALMLSIVAFPVLPAEVWHTAYLQRVYPQADGKVLLAFTSDHAQCSYSSSPKYHAITVGQNSVTADGLRAMQSAALMAFAMGRQVSIAFDDATSNCYVNRLIIRES